MSRGTTKKQRRLAASDHSPIAGLIRLKEHFFGGMDEAIDRLIDDPRDRARITYGQPVLIHMVGMKSMSGVVSMQGMNESFNTARAIRNLGRISGDEGLREAPDWQTFNNYAERVDPAGFEGLLAYMVNTLIRSKQFDRHRVLDAFPVIFDGTGIAYFKERHCEHDLVYRHVDEKTGKETVGYYHKVLVAKIVLAPKVVLTLGVEFIENEDEDVAKQDCENRAAKRLMEKIHRRFPRLPVIMMGDALYAVQPIMSICREYGWRYIFNIKKESQKTVCEDFEDMIRLGEAESLGHRLGDEDGTITFANGVGEISLKEEAFNMLRYQYTRDDGRSLMFQWVTDIRITGHNAERLCRTGRGRWKVENEGFNFQKNGIFQIGHLCSRDSNAMKIHFLVTQVADILMQLYLAFDKAVNYRAVSIKTAARDLLASFQKDCFFSDIEFITKRTAYHMVS